MLNVYGLLDLPLTPQLCTCRYIDHALSIWDNYPLDDCFLGKSLKGPHHFKSSTSQQWPKEQKHILVDWWLGCWNFWSLGRLWMHLFWVQPIFKIHLPKIRHPTSMTWCNSLTLSKKNTLGLAWFSKFRPPNLPQEDQKIQILPRNAWRLVVIKVMSGNELKLTQKLWWQTKLVIFCSIIIYPKWQITSIRIRTKPTSIIECHKKSWTLLNWKKQQESTEPWKNKKYLTFHWILVV